MGRRRRRRDEGPLRGRDRVTSCARRFVPDDVTFEEPPRDVATGVNLATYAPKFFTSAASATSKVADESAPPRRRK